MFGQKEMESNGHRVNALLEQGCEFEGKLTFEGTVRVNGCFKGEIFSEGTLVVGEGAVLEAQIEVGCIIINGKVAGSIDAKDRIEMKSSAEVRGDIRARTLIIEEGVLFEGNCKMGEARAPAPARTEETLHAFAAEEDEGRAEEGFASL